jgi:uncharacterized damage-inducible protein DinB
MNKTQSQMLAQYNQWANNTLLSALEKIPHEEITRPRRSLFRDIGHTLNHLLVIERIWKGHLIKQPHGYTARNTPEYPEFSELATQLRESDEWWVQWTKRQSETDLAESVKFNYVNGQPGTMTGMQIIQHIVIHNSYHRGYIGDLMYQIPECRAPQMDFSVYCTDVMKVE